MKTQVLRFAAAGAVGYIVDTLVLYVAMAFGIGFLRGRVLSFVCAVMVTFVLNRRFTFNGQLQGASGRGQPLWLEFGQYLIAMALGGLLNLLTYWFVLSKTPHFPAIYAIAVGAGSLVGMTINFASAKWWVFNGGRRPGTIVLPRITLVTAACLIVPQLAFWLAHLHEMALPGLYMDAVNPDYLAARALNPELPNPVAMQPTTGLIVIGSLYHGVQNYYVGMPIFALLGFSILALRIAQGLFASGIILLTHVVLRRASGSIALAFAGSLSMATELAFIASFRTQMYIVMSGAFWLLLALYFALGSRPASIGNQAPAQFAKLPLLVSGACAGLAVYSYFVFLFFLPVFVIAGWLHTRSWRPVLFWLLGFAAGMQTYVLGYTLALISLGGLEPMLDWLNTSTVDLNPLSSVQTLGQRWTYAWSLFVMSLENWGNEAMIFGSPEPAVWPIWKVRLLVYVPLLFAAVAFARSIRQRSATAEAPALVANWHIALLPVTFVVVSTYFGDRLWSHHFSALIPVSYLGFFLGVHYLKAATRVAIPTWVGAVLTLVFLGANVHQQQVFFERLSATGGNAYFSDALNRLAEDAMNTDAELVHVFPEWGFYMPFALLTGNSRQYEVELNDATLQRLVTSGRHLRLCYWTPENESTYRDQLLAYGYGMGNNETYLQRDGGIAFYCQEAVPPTGALPTPATE
jgi:putative flippase GtrA